MDIKLQAHRGVEREYPGNTMSAFRAAVSEGYDFIELDIGLTKDGKYIVMHDGVINTTGRNPDGSKIEEKIRISDITYEEALGYDFGIWFSEKFRGEKPPLFEDVLKLAKENGVFLKIDNKIRKFSEKERDGLYELIKKVGTYVFISCWSYESALDAHAKLPDAELHFDGLYDEEILQKISSLVGKENFAIWMPVDQSVGWIPREWFVTPEKNELVKKYAKAALWAIRDRDTYEKAVELYEPWAVETDGLIKPEK